MIDKKEITYIRNNYSVGQEVPCNKHCGGERLVRVNARIIGKFPHICLVEHKGQKWCIQWIDLIMEMK